MNINMSYRKLQVKNFFTRDSLIDFALLNLGSILTAVGSYFFKFPNHFSIGGITGLAVIISKYYQGLSTATISLILNMVLLVVGFLVIGRGFGIKTAYTTIMISGLVSLFEIIVPLDAPLTSQPFLELVFAVALPSVGAAILFNISASSGGTDIIAMIFAKYTTINISKGLMYSDILITLGSFVFGVETGLMSLLGLVMKTLIIDNSIENINLHKYLTIITSKPDEVKAFITDRIKKGATLLEGEGAYTGEKRTLILTVTSPSQAVIIRRYVHKIDPNSFILITNTSEIIGKGFRSEP